MDVEQNELQGVLVHKEDWRLRGQTARYIHPTDPAYRYQLAVRNVSIIRQEAMLGYINLDDLGYELSGRNPHSAPYLARIQHGYEKDIEIIARRAVDRMT